MEECEAVEIIQKMALIFCFEESKCSAGTEVGIKTRLGVYQVVLIIGEGSHNSSGLGTHNEGVQQLC
jgi:hypothetical protein